MIADCLNEPDDEAFEAFVSDMPPFEPLTSLSTLLPESLAGALPLSPSFLAALLGFFGSSNSPFILACSNSLGESFFLTSGSLATSFTDALDEES
jgi:hypothetical protein